MASYKETVLATPGLVSLWPLDESSGNALDAKGSNPGEPKGSIIRGQSSLLPNGEGASAQMDGSTGFFQVADAASLDLGDTFSIEAWIKPDVVTGAPAYGIIGKGTLAYYMRILGASSKLQMNKAQSVDMVLSTVALTKETVAHVVATKTGATLKLYINGVDVTGAVTNATCENNTKPLLIGSCQFEAGPTEFFDGFMQYAAVYNVALSEATIKEHFAAGSISPLFRGERKKPPLELDIEVGTPNGTFVLPYDAIKATKRPRGRGFSTQRGDGFGPATAQLSRQIFRDYPDIGLLDPWRFIGQNGEIAYEGRLHSNPRTNSPEQTIDMALVGWMTYLKRRKISPLIIDRRLGGWGDPSTQRQADQVTGGKKYEGSMSAGFQDSGAKGPAVVFAFSKLVPALVELREAWFYAGGEALGAIKVGAVERLVGSADTNYTALVRLAKDDVLSVSDDSTDLNLGNSTNVTVPALAADRKYGVLHLQYDGAAEGDVSPRLAFIHPRVIGTHGLTPRGEEPQEGYYLSDIIGFIGTYYPKIDFSGVLPNSFLVRQATWHDNPADGWAIIQQLNDLALWETNVWEGPKFHFEPADLGKYDWQFRTDDPGVEVRFEGDSIENFANGVAVTYTDFWGVVRTLYPPDHPELRDDSESNPANKHGEYNWIPDMPPVPFPCTEAEALQFGRAYLAEFNRPKRPGTYRIHGGYIQDSAGHWQQGWKPRCSQTVGILDHPEDFPRLITATNWDDEEKVLEITVDAPPKTLDAMVARHELARTAANLTS